MTEQQPNKGNGGQPGKDTGIQWRGRGRSEIVPVRDDYPPMIGKGTYVLGGVAVPLFAVPISWWLNRYSGPVPLNVAGAMEGIGAGTFGVDVYVAGKNIADLSRRVRAHLREKKEKRDLKRWGPSPLASLQPDTSSNARPVEELQDTPALPKRITWPRVRAAGAVLTPPVAVVASYYLNRAGGQAELNIAGATEVAGAAVTLYDIAHIDRPVKAISRRLRQGRARRKAQRKPKEK